MRCAVLWLVAGLVTACGTTSPPAPQPPPAAPGGPASAAGGGIVLGGNERLLIYVPRADDSLRAIAARFLGSEDRAWMIAEANGGVAAPSAGEPLVVPRKPLNARGVQADRYQTVTILCYHRFGPGGGKMTVSPANFAAQLDWLARNDYHVVRLAQLGGFLEGREALPQRSVVLSFDDGYASVLKHALPVLRKYRAPATVFVYTDFVGAGDALGWADLQALAASGLVDVQAHSKSHRNLLDRIEGESDARYRQAVEIETRAPRELLERRLKVQVRHFAYPYGDANETVLEVLARQGYQLGATVNPGGNAFFAQPLMLRRTMIYGDHTIDAFRARLQTSRAIGGAGALLPGAWAGAAPAGASADAALDAELFVALRDGAADPVAAFERGQLERALAAARDGRLADAALAWEVLRLLQPESAEYRERGADTQQRIDQALAEQLRLGARELERGGLDEAQRHYLLALGLSPEQAQAADALRGIERERNRRYVLGRPSRLMQTRRLADAERAPALADRNDIEHAALLATQGEFDDAVRLLSARLAVGRSDATVRAALADVHWRKGESLASRDPAAAIAALRLCLQLDPAHARARERLRQLQSANAAPR